VTGIPGLHGLDDLSGGFLCASHLREVPDVGARAIYNLHFVVSSLGLLMAGYHDARTKSLYSVKARNPLFPLRGPSQSKHLVNFVVGDVASDYGVEHRIMEHGGRSDVALAHFNDAQLVPFEEDEVVVERRGDGGWQCDVVAKIGKKGLHLRVVMSVDVVDDPGRRYDTRAGESSRETIDTEIVVGMTMCDEDVGEPSCRTSRSRRRAHRPVP
jgi:hypothetical protein